MLDVKIGFGQVARYFSEKGFGFVKNLFPGESSETFFHITTIKRTDSDLAKRLDSEATPSSIELWYEVEVTPKGRQMRTVLSAQAIRERSGGEVADLTQKVEGLWGDRRVSIPDWLPRVTAQLLGSFRADELYAERIAFEAEREREVARRLEELRVARETEEAERRREHEARLAQQKAQEEIEEKEFRELVSEMAPLGFRHSSQLSRYIVENRLGLKYENISGVLEMRQKDSTWSFNGGFPTHIYARLCGELNLGNFGTQAKPVKFESFRDLAKKRS